MNLILERIKRSPRLQQYLKRRYVRIYSGDGRCYWRQNQCGYTDREHAGIWNGAEAYRLVSHCGPEKQIQFDVIPPTPKAEPPVYWQSLREMMPAPWSMDPANYTDAMGIEYWQIRDARGRVLIPMIPKMVADRILCAVNAEPAHLNLRSDVCLYMAAYIPDKPRQLEKVGMRLEESYQAMNGIACVSGAI